MSASTRVPHLYIETESEQQRESGICLAGKKEINYISQYSVGRAKPVGDCKITIKNIVMLKIMEQHYRKKCESAQCINYIKSLRRRHGI